MSDTPKFNTNDPEAVEIRRKVAALGLELYDVITPAEVRAFETVEGVKLPADYVWFITNVGNGGTWRYCNTKYEFYTLAGEEDEPRFAYCADGSSPNGKIEKYALRALDLGDAYAFGIILTGGHYGETADICNLKEAYFHKNKSVHNFKELYTAWLDDAYLGYETKYFFLRHRGTVEELFDKYLQNKEDQYLWSISLKINKRSASEEFVERVHTEFLRENNNEKQIGLCDILMNAGFDDPLSLIKRIFRPKNYTKIIDYLKDNLNYFEHWLEAEGVMEGAEAYYPILIEILKYFNTLSEFPYEGIHFRHCFEMTVMNPKFNENDIIEVLKSKNKIVLDEISLTYAETVMSRVKKYVKAAEKKSRRK